MCGDALSGKVINELRRIGEALPAQLAAEPIQLPSWGIDFYAPNGRRLAVPFKPNYNTAHDRAAGHISKRIDFDNFLVEEVRQPPRNRLPRKHRRGPPRAAARRPLAPVRPKTTQEIATADCCWWPTGPSRTLRA